MQSKLAPFSARQGHELRALGVLSSTHLQREPVR
jgi:hypothetical protein